MSIDLIDTARPKNSGTFPIVLQTDVKGGIHQVANAAARTSIATERRVDGLLVYQQDTGDVWKLSSDLTTWNIAQFQVVTSMTSNAILRVDAGGGSDSNASRPSRISGGDWTAYPFATVQAAIDSLLKDTGGFYHRVNCDPDTFAAGVTVQGFTGGGTVDIVGDFVNSTLTTGLNTGTAGSGTTTTAVKKPTGAADWTVDNLRGKIFLPTGGGGYYADTQSNLILNSGPCMRVIKGNTVDTITIDALNGVNSTTTFRIVDVATLLGQAAASYGPLTYSVGLFGNTARVWLRNLKNNAGSVFYGFFGQGNRLLEFYGLDIATTAFAGMGIYDTDNLSCRSLWAHGGSTSLMDVFNGGRGQFTNLVLDNSRLQMDHFRRAVATVSAKACTGTAVRMRQNSFVALDLDANSCTVTPLSLTANARFQANGAGFTGSNPSAAYGVIVDGGGYYTFTGASLSGAADLSLDGAAVTWANLGVRNYQNGGTFAYWSDNKWTMLGQFRILNNSSDNFDDLQVSSIQIESYKKEYCADRALPTTDTGAGDYSAGAYAEVIPATAGTQGAATIIGTQQTLVRANGGTADGHSIRFFTDVEKGGTGFGTHGTIRNGSGFIVRLYPPTGKKIFFVGVDQGTDNYIELGPGRVDWLTDKDGNWWVD